MGAEAYYIRPPHLGLLLPFAHLDLLRMKAGWDKELHCRQWRVLHAVTEAVAMQRIPRVYTYTCHGNVVCGTYSVILSLFMNQRIVHGHIAWRSSGGMFRKL